MIDRLEEILKKYNSLQEELLKPEVLSNVSSIKSLSKEKSDLEEIVIEYNKYKKIMQSLNEAEQLLNDSDLVVYAKEEIEKLNIEKSNTEDKLELMLVPKDPNDNKNVLFEIRGAAGGDEANIFAGDLFDMYYRYVEEKKWKLEIINEVKGSSGGYSQIEFLIKGNGAYSKLKYESGTHRVQRVPETESQGRVHTSTATVIVLPEHDDIDIEIKESDIKVDVYRSGGAGGQSVNTTDSAVRMTHIPTGIVVTCQNERSQIQNREKAMQILKSKIYEETIRQHEEKEDAERRTKIGNGDRAEKIRTYNYPQNRVTDHRINFTLMNLDRIMLGKLDDLIEELINEDQKRKLQNN